MMKLFVAVLLMPIITMGCSADIAEMDSEYLQDVLLELKIGNSAKDTIAFFKKHGHDLQIYSNCSMAVVEDLSSCDNGYRSTGIIKLPSSNSEHGVGLARVYIRLGREGVLRDYFHDLYYEKLDNR